jgi:hypothetical protein
VTNAKNKNDDGNENGPRVFEEGALTLVIGPDSFNLYVGPTHLGCVDEAEANLNVEKSAVGIKLRKKNSKHDQELEDCIRLIKTLPWVKIT